MSCYDAVQGKGYLWTSGWFRGGSVSVWASPPRSLLPPCVFEGRRSLCYLLPVNWLVTEKFGGGKNVLLELITSTFLTILCPCCRLNPDSFLVRQYNMCLVLADSHVYKVHICVHTCNTRYSSNLLL